MTEQYGNWGIQYLAEPDSHVPDFMTGDALTAIEVVEDYLYPSDIILSAFVKWHGTETWVPYQFSDAELALRTA